jgi:hypothetical protein
MNIRTGFDRLSKLLLALLWALFLLVFFVDGMPNPAEFGESLVYMLVFTVAYMLFCKAVAWVYNGFTNKQP